MFHPSILELESQIQYHQEQQELAEQELDRLKMTQAFAEDAAAKVEDALEHIEPKYLDVFKEHLLSLFPKETPIYPEESSEEEDDIEYMDDSNPDYKSIEQLQSEEPDTVVAVFHSEEYLKEQEEGLLEIIEEEETQTPTFEEINSRVIYNHNHQTVYLGMTAKNRCDYYGQYLTGQLTVGEKYTYSKEPSFINGEEYKYELRITEINLEDAVHLASFNLQKDPEHPDNAKLLTDWRANKVRKLDLGKPSDKLVPIAEVELGEIVYLNSINNQYKVLQRVKMGGIDHLECICVYNSERPSLVGETSYFNYEVYRVPSDSIKVDSTLQKEQEEVLTENVQVYVPLKKSEEINEKNFPPAPYSEVPLAELELCDIVTTSSHVQTFYEITQNLGNCIKARCLYSRAFPNRVGEEYTLSTAYLVERAFDMAVAV